MAFGSACTVPLDHDCVAIVPGGFPGKGKAIVHLSASVAQSSTLSGAGAPDENVAEIA